MANKINITINFDMDGTIADLYANPNWLPLLRAFDPTPYATAKPLLRLNVLARKLDELHKAGLVCGRSNDDHAHGEYYVIWSAVEV